MFKKLLVICLKKFLVELMIDVLTGCLEDMAKKSDNTIDDKVANIIIDNENEIIAAIKGAL